VIQISVMNQSTVIDDDAVQEMLPALMTQWNEDLIPVWPVEECNVQFVAKDATPDAGTWWAVFLDDATQAGALALHDLTDDGFPIAKIFCKTIKEDQGASISVAASHEFLEMAVDPWLNMAAQDSSGRFWALEIADPCEDDQYAYTINGVLVSDFASPAWFGHANTTPGAAMDLKGHVAAAFSILTGGYAQYFDPKAGWQQELGQEAANHQRLRHPPQGSRRERRARKFHSGLRKSAFLSR
jgi:hypothetical protein